MNRRAGGSALLIVMTVMTGLTFLLTAWWQAAGWAGDLALVRQRYMNQFYSTEVVLNYGLAWVKKEFEVVVATLAKTKQSLTMDGGTVSLDHGGVGRCTLTIEFVPGDAPSDHPQVVRVTATMVVDGKPVACHRCLLEREVVDGGQGPAGQGKKEQRFVVHHWSI